MSKITDIALPFFIILALIGGVTSYDVNKDYNELRDMTADVFYDYCKDKGGITAVKDVEIHLPDVEVNEDLKMYSCLNNDHYGIMMVNEKENRIVYYITEDG